MSTAVVAALGGSVSAASAQTPDPTVAPQIQKAAAARKGRPVRKSASTSTKGASAPESGQGQVTNANATAPNAGVLPFIPPQSGKIPGVASLAIDTKGVSVNSLDDFAKFRIGGRLQTDFSAASISPSKFGPAVPTAVGIRRSYFETYLSIQGGYELAFQYDFNDPVREIVDAVVAYHGYSPLVITVGNFKEPFSFNQLQSDNTTTFTERSLADTFAPGRDFGAAIGGAFGNLTATAGVFGANANFGPENNGVAGTARVTYAPINTKDQVLHVGVAGSYRALDNGISPNPSFSSKPEDYLFARALVSTGGLSNSADVGRIGGEFLYQYQSYRLQAEYIAVDVFGRPGTPDRSFQGGYVEGAWVVNGKGRPYRLAPPYGADFGILQGVQVEDNQRISNGGIGVFELAARYSQIDLRSTGVNGGTENDITAGVNWYPDRNIRTMLDYVHANADPAALSVGKGSSISSDLVVGRLQVFW